MNRSTIMNGTWYGCPVADEVPGEHVVQVTGCAGCPCAGVQVGADLYCKLSHNYVTNYGSGMGVGHCPLEDGDYVLSRKPEVAWYA